MYTLTLSLTVTYTYTCTHIVTDLLTHSDDDIFYTPAKTPPKKKKQWMDDLLDDDKDLFGDIKADNKDSTEAAPAVAPSMEKKEGETTKPKSGGGLFDDLPLDDEDEPLSKSEGQASNINGHKGKVASHVGWTCTCTCSD